MKKNPIFTVAPGEGVSDTILDSHGLVLYCVPMYVHLALVDRLEDLALNAIAESRKGQRTIPVSIDDL